MIPDQVEAAERAIPSVRHICQWVSRGKLSNMRIWRNRKRAENNHCCAELGQKTLDWTRKCVIRWSYRQSEFKLVVTKAQTTAYGWQNVLKLEGISFHNQPRPIHDKEQASDHRLAGTMTIESKMSQNHFRLKCVTKLWEQIELLLSIPSLGKPGMPCAFRSI